MSRLLLRAVTTSNIFSVERKSASLHTLKQLPVVMHYPIPYVQKNTFLTTQNSLLYFSDSISLTSCTCKFK